MIHIPKNPFWWMALFMAIFVTAIEVFLIGLCVASGSWLSVLFLGPFIAMYAPQVYMAWWNVFWFYPEN